MTLASAILQTLSYHARYNFPLTLSELHRYLITNIPVSRSRVEEELQNLLTIEKVKISKNFYFLSNLSNMSNSTNLTNSRLLRQTHSAVKLQISRRAAHLLSFLPTIKLICVTGSLAMKNCDESDDIDLMIVTSADSLWLTRPLVVLLVSLFFKRRWPNLTNLSNSTNLTNSLCLNLWLDTTALKMPISHQNLRVAHELAQMQPILNKNQTYEKMLIANFWLKKYLANFILPPRPLLIPQIPQTLQNPFNWLFFRLQLLYMSPRHTTEKVGLHFAFFHPEPRLAGRGPERGVFDEPKD